MGLKTVCYPFMPMDYFGNVKFNPPSHTAVLHINSKIFQRIRLDIFKQSLRFKNPDKCGDVFHKLTCVLHFPPTLYRCLMKYYNNIW